MLFRSLGIGRNSLTGSIPSFTGSFTSLIVVSLIQNSLTGTIPSLSALTSMTYLVLTNNYLTMGSQTSVPTSTFSSATLNGVLRLEDNCLAFSTDYPYPSRSVTATHCRPISKYQLCNHVISFLHHHTSYTHNSDIIC